jgi:hypothetical protein
VYQILGTGVPVNCFHHPEYEFCVPLRNPGKALWTDDALSNQRRNCRMLFRTILTPMQEVPIYAVPAGPGIKIFHEWVPDFRSISAGNDKICHRLTHIVAKCR